jgi:KDO2-lipid IV(A) lauroyltransferase
MNFFSKPAPFMHVPEKNAQRTNVPVGFASFKKIKRGHYRFETTMVTMDPASLPKGELTRMYRDFLEKQISEQPDNYLWSHRRWKSEYKEEYKEMWIG